MKPDQEPQIKKTHRRSLSHIGGRVETKGQEEFAVRLSTIMSGDMDKDSARLHVHGFHSFPARMHPTIAHRGIELLSSPGDTLLDPFCGSGTVLVESRLAGRRSWGIDINPLAVLLARLKTEGASHSQLLQMVAAAKRIADHAETRRRQKLGASRRYPPEDVDLFDPHVLLELDGLHDGLCLELDKIADRNHSRGGPPHRQNTEDRVSRQSSQRPEFMSDALRLVLSSILVKVSRKPGDSSSIYMPRRIAAGFVISLYERKALELAQQVECFCKRLPPLSPIAKVREGDARDLGIIPDASIQLVLTSPPYAGTYDYIDHHRLRCRWLGLRTDDMQRTELGARRHLKPLQHADAIRRYQSDLTTVLSALSSKLVNGGKVAVLLADSVVSSTVGSHGGTVVWDPVWAEPLVRRCGEQAGLTWIATASQQRPHYHAPSRDVFSRQPRREHLVLLARVVQRSEHALCLTGKRPGDQRRNR